MSADQLCHIKRLWANFTNLPFKVWG